MATRIQNFDDWMDLFKSWQKDIGLDVGELGDYQWDVKFGELENAEIEFGAYAGQPKWENLIEIPDQRIRDALLSLIRVQGDTEFASTEQQRYLFDTAPSDFDRQSLARIICEETRHGWQMALPVSDIFRLDRQSRSSEADGAPGVQKNPFTRCVQ